MDIKKLRICSIDYDVNVCDQNGWAENGMGRFIEIENKILINEKLSEDVAFATLLHECLHAIVDINDLFKISDEETHICILANSLHAFLKDNKQFLTFYNNYKNEV